ncbi:hypothetical protein N431DRAFT_557867 [Stipitochalara longipes BDJ]|nr:hypothetical protein N431DRAFT_557867 [Stipitochalara longipes BDJ]
MDVPESHAPDQLQCFSHIPFNQRWEHLKPVIRRYYVDQGFKISDLAKTMKEYYKFDAFERQYKYHLKKWDIGKIVPTSVKEQACKVLGKRSRDAASTSTVEYNGERIDKAKLRRYMISLARQDNALRLGNNVFLHWNLPYKALKASKMSINDTTSPFGHPIQTPNYISVTSPSVAHGDAASRNALSPMNVQSPNDAPTPTMLAIRNKQLDDRAKLLIQGRHDELLNSMEKGERQVATTWLYQFWLFSYKTAKYWGRGPQDWSASVLRFTDFQDQRTTANTPQTYGGTPMNISNHEDDMYRSHLPRRDQSDPLKLCFWSIHGIDDLEYVRDAPPPQLESIEDFEAIDEADWPDWPEKREYFGFVDKLQMALKTNSFSSVDINDLPLSLSQVAQSAEQPPDQLLLEALGFAIMARNEDLLWELMEDIEFLDLSCLSPFHLAASYICGAKTCCNVLDFVVKHFSGPEISQRLYVNPLGHTVLDTLMMGILKSHTSCLPGIVDGKLAKDKRFVGEDLDVCGSCGRQLQLQPVHCLVMVAFHLSQSGRPDENLFGILACLVCMLVNGANPLVEAHVSIDMLMGREMVDICSHSSLDPLQFAEQIPKDLVTEWTDDVRLGWSVFCKVLGFAQDERRKAETQTSVERYNRARGLSMDFDDLMIGEDHAGNAFGQNFEEQDEDEEDGEEVWCRHHKTHGNFYDGNREIGILWGAIQTELLTYRKVEEDDAWISNNFVMQSLLGGLENGFGVSLLPLIENGMMKPVCRCGRFREAHDEACVMVQESSAWYFSNTDIWKRATYIVIPEYRTELWYRH